MNDDLPEHLRDLVPPGARLRIYPEMFQKEPVGLIYELRQQVGQIVYTERGVIAHRELWQRRGVDGGPQAKEQEETRLVTSLAMRLDAAIRKGGR